MNFKKIFAVAKKEFLFNLKRKEFLLMTFLLPVFMFGITSLAPLSQGMMEKSDVGVVDNSMLFNISDFKNRSSIINFIEIPAEENARESILSGKIKGYVVIPKDYFNSRNMTFYSASGFPIGEEVQAALKEISLETYLKKENLNPEIIEFAREPVKLKSITITKEGEEKEENILSFIGMILFPLLFVMVIFFSAGFLLYGIIEEKENRVSEILLSSITSEDLFIGKIIGLGSLGITQLTVWGLLALPMLFLSILSMNITIYTVVIVLIFFILGYVFYACIFAAIGSISTTLKESNQIVSIFSITAMSPIFFIAPLMSNPNSLIFKIITFIPFLTPTMIMFRLGNIEIYEIILGVIVMLASIYVAVKISSKIFKIGMLSYGKRPALKEVIRWIK